MAVTVKLKEQVPSLAVGSATADGLSSMKALARGLATMVESLGELYLPITVTHASSGFKLEFHVDKSTLYNIMKTAPYLKPEVEVSYGSHPYKVSLLIGVQEEPEILIRIFSVGDLESFAAEGIYLEGGVEGAE